MLSLDLVSAVAVVVSVVAACALCYAILQRAFDYDEVEHAHAVWLVSRGQKPFYDFFECHPPFLWYPLSLLFRVFGDSYDVLFMLRFIAAFGQVACLVALAKNAALSLRGLGAAAALPAGAAAIAIAVLMSQPLLFDYFVEFRVDSWPNAVLLIAVYRYRLRREDAFRSSLKLAALSTAAVLCSPKLVMFAALFAAASVLLDDRRLARAAGLVAGGAGALAVAVLLLLLAGLNPISVLRLPLQYHHLLVSKGTEGSGLAEVVLQEMTVSRNIMIASLIAWALVSWRRIHRAPFELAVLAFLVLQLLFVTIPYKQYYAPLFMLGTVFVPYLEVLARRIRGLHSLLLAVAFVYVAGNALDLYRDYSARHEVADNFRARKELGALVPRSGTIVGTIETMPLFRRSAVYQLVNSLAGNGYDGARVMQELQIHPFSDNFTEEAASRQLEGRHPDLIVTGASYPPYLRKALDGFVARHAGEYFSNPSNPAVLLRRR